MTSLTRQHHKYKYQSSLPKAELRRQHQLMTNTNMRATMDIVRTQKMNLQSNTDVMNAIKETQYPDGHGIDICNRDESNTRYSSQARVMQLGIILEKEIRSANIDPIQLIETEMIGHKLDAYLSNETHIEICNPTFTERRGIDNNNNELGCILKSITMTNIVEQHKQVSDNRHQHSIITTHEFITNDAQDNDLIIRGKINNSNNQRYLLSNRVTQQVISDLIVRKNDYYIVYDISIDNLPTKQNNENDNDNYIIQSTCMKSLSNDCDIDITQEGTKKASIHDIIDNIYGVVLYQDDIMNKNESKNIQQCTTESETIISSQRFTIDIANNNKTFGRSNKIMTSIEKTAIMNLMTTGVHNNHNDDIEDQCINNLVAIQTFDPGGLIIAFDPGGNRIICSNITMINNERMNAIDIMRRDLIKKEANNKFIVFHAHLDIGFVFWIYDNNANLRNEVNNTNMIRGLSDMIFNFEYMTTLLVTCSTFSKQQTFTSDEIMLLLIMTIDITINTEYLRENGRMICITIISPAQQLKMYVIKLLVIFILNMYILDVNGGQLCMNNSNIMIWIYCFNGCQFIIYGMVYLALNDISMNMMEWLQILIKTSNLKYWYLSVTIILESKKVLEMKTVFMMNNNSLGHLTIAMLHTIRNILIITTTYDKCIFSLNAKEKETFNID